ncbi:MAG: ATP-binding protein [bacterium]
MREIHNLLQQQLDQHLGPSRALADRCEQFIQAVNETYWQFEKKCQELEHSLQVNPQELTEANAEMRAVFRAVSDMFLRLNRDGKILYFKGSAEIEHLMPPDKVVGSYIHEIKQDDVAKEFASAIEGVRQNRKKCLIEYAVERDGQKQFYEARLLPFFADMIIVAIRNITERKIVELELKRVHAETEQLLASISSILIGVDSKDRVTRWNKAAEMTFGLPAEQVIGRGFIQCGIKWEWIDVLENIAVCRDRDKPSRLDDVRFTRPDGKEGYIAITINPVVSDKKEHSGYLLLGAEITDRKILENQLAQAQKLESIGQLAAGVAHEINTPTQYVGDNVRFLAKGFERLQMFIDKCHELLEQADNAAMVQETVAEARSLSTETKVKYMSQEIPVALEETLEGVQRIAGIVKAMKEYSHPGGKEKIPVDINKALENTILVSRSEWKYHAEMEMELNPSLPPVLCFPGELNQVFLNIIVNASHAIMDANKKLSRQKGTITISTDYDDQYAIIKISDTGTGIPREHRDKIFDPFFTTKEVGKGTGQGLAISHNVVVEKHGGGITFETQEGKGTTFSIRLPFEASR